MHSGRRSVGVISNQHQHRSDKKFPHLANVCRKYVKNAGRHARPPLPAALERQRI
jgi:hypothetical protein